MQHLIWAYQHWKNAHSKLLGGLKQAPNMHDSIWQKMCTHVGICMWKWLLFIDTPQNVNWLFCEIENDFFDSSLYVWIVSEYFYNEHVDFITKKKF